jgi:hypothetical protein
MRTLIVLTGVLSLASAMYAQVHRDVSLDDTQVPKRLIVRAQPKTGRHAPGIRRNRDAATPIFEFNSATYNVGSNPRFVATSDLNGDGILDLIVANDTSGDLSVLMGNPDGTFQSPVTYSYGTRPFWIVAADFNGDGMTDVAVSGGGGIVIYLNVGNGTLFESSVYLVSSFAPSLAVADINGDGRLDLVWSGYNNDTANVMLGKGDGTFQPSLSYPTGRAPEGIVTGDFNNDAKLDLATANEFFSISQNFPGTMSVLLGNGDGTFQGFTNYDATEDPYGIAVGDFNSDGNLDAVVANSGDEVVTVFLGRGDGSFENGVEYGGDVGCIDVIVADFDLDGKLDLAVANTNSNDVSILLGNGDGTFQPALNFATGTAPYAVATGDFNRDGYLDLVTANYVGTTITVLTRLQPTVSTLVSSSNPSSFGQLVTFTDTVSPKTGQGVPSGTVTFYDGTKQLGSSSLNSGGVAAISTSALKVGTHSISAVYGGDSTFASSTSNVLSQVVQGAIATLSGNQANFGEQTVDLTSSPVNITLSNTGNIAMSISSISISGPNKTDFAQTNTCGASLPAGGTCTIAITFTPLATGSRSATLKISDNAPNSPQTVSLTGTGVTPTAVVSPTSLTFPVQVIFTTSASQNIQLSNTGQGILTISSIAAASPFVQSNNCGSSLSPLSSCTISVRFKPRAGGQVSRALTITDNASGSPQSVQLTGIGTYIETNPTSENFGSQPVGTTSLPRNVIVTNKGDNAVSIRDISITGTNASDFAETNTCGSSLASGASCKIVVTFTPSAKGKRTANVAITDNGGGSPQLVALSGTGT